MHFQAFGEDWIPKFGVLDGVTLVYDPDAFYLVGGLISMSGYLRFSGIAYTGSL
jgi:hypothetical protein